VPYGDLQEILTLAIGWEKELKNLYDVAAVALRDQKSKKLVALLRERLVKNLQVLEAVDVNKYGKAIWVMYSSVFRTDDLIPKTKLKKDFTPKEILDHILECEEKLRDFYTTTRDLLVSREPEELFDSLVAFKTGQIIEIKNSLEGYEFT